MAEEDIPKTAICTPFGLFEYIFMQFGIKNAAQTFQRLMDRFFRHLPFVFVYLDDILIASKDSTQHIQHLRLVFEVLQDAGLRINPAKCTFLVSSLSFLGHNLDASGISPMEKHVKALADFPPPSDLKDLQRFLGLINFLSSISSWNRRYPPASHGFAPRQSEGATVVRYRRRRLWSGQSGPHLCNCPCTPVTRSSDIFGGGRFRYPHRRHATTLLWLLATACFFQQEVVNSRIEVFYFRQGTASSLRVNPPLPVHA